MMILLATSDHRFHSWQNHPHIGRLLVPVGGWDRAVFTHCYTAADNCAYSRWDERKFVAMLLTHSSHASNLQWVAVPDVVGNWRETRSRFNKWGEMIAGLEYRLAYVLQDGQPREEVPWCDIACVFLGGSTAYKLSNEALLLCSTAKERGKLVHIGRCNSIKRLNRFLLIADSLDGMSYSRWPNRNLPRILKHLSTTPSTRTAREVLGMLFSSEGDNA